MDGSVHIKKNAQAKYTIIAYICADNNLDYYGRADINKMKAGCDDSVPDVNVIALLDLLHEDTTAYYIRHDTSIKLVVPGLSSEVDMGDPATLITFVKFCMTNYPADHYVLDLWDHGTGWSICYDQTSNNDALTMAELGTALKTINGTMNRKLDILCMDACLMGTLEVAYEVAPYVNILITSEDTIPATGYPYTEIVQDLYADPGQNITTFSTKIVDLFHVSYPSYYQTTLSALNLSKVNSNIFPNFALFTQYLYSYLDFGIKNEIYNARVVSQEFYDPNFIDLYDFTKNTKNKASNTTIQTLAQHLMTNISATIIKEKHYNRPGAHGLTIYFPEAQSSYQNKYATHFSLANNTMWDEFLQKYYRSVSFGVALRYYMVNNTPNPGEAILMDIKLENIGIYNGISVNGTLICLDTENVTVFTKKLSYGNILPKQNATRTFLFNISKSCAIEYHLPFVIITQGQFNTYLILRNFTFELIVGRKITIGGWDLPSATQIIVGTIYGILPGLGSAGVSWLKINCSANYYLFLNLTAPELTDFDAYVYNSAGDLLSAAVKPNYPDECCLLAQYTGYYYIKLVPSIGGNCYYEMFVNITTVAFEDGSSFGIAITLSGSTTVNNSLPGPGVYGYFFYRVILSKGQRLRAFLTGPNGSDFDLYIYDPNLNQIAQSINPTASESCGIFAYSSGYYYILIVPCSGSGQFTLKIQVEGFEAVLRVIIILLIVVAISFVIGLALYHTLMRKSQHIASINQDLSVINEDLSDIQS